MKRYFVVLVCALLMISGKAMEIEEEHLPASFLGEFAPHSSSSSVDSAFEGAGRVLLEGYGPEYTVKSEMAEMAHNQQHSDELTTANVEVKLPQQVEMEIVPTLIEQASAADADADAEAETDMFADSSVETDLDILNGMDAEKPEVLEQELTAEQEADLLSQRDSEFTHHLEERALMAVGAQSNTTDSITPKGANALNITDADAQYYAGQAVNARKAKAHEHTQGRVEAYSFERKNPRKKYPKALRKFYKKLKQAAKAEKKALKKAKKKAKKNALKDPRVKKSALYKRRKARTDKDTARFAAVDADVESENHAEHELENRVLAESEVQVENTKQKQVSVESESSSLAGTEAGSNVEFTSGSQGSAATNTATTVQTATNTQCANGVCPRSAPVNVERSRFVRAEIVPRRRNTTVPCAPPAVAAPAPVKAWVQPAFKKAPPPAHVAQRIRQRRRRRQNNWKWVKPIVKPYGFFDSQNSTSSNVVVAK